MRTMLFKPLALVALAAVLTPALAGGIAHSRRAAAGLQGAPHDLQFIDMMIMHHQGGIEMARMAESKGRLAQLKEFARKSVEDQQKDTEELQSRRDQLFSGQPKAESMMMRGRQMTMAEMQKKMQDDMSKLQAAAPGNQFDRTFLDLFTEHHRMAIQMSRDEVAMGRQAEIKAIAQKTIDKQSKDINEMSRMKRMLGGKRGKKG